MGWGSLCDWMREVFPVESLREVTCGPALRVASGTWSLTPPSQDSWWRWQDGGRAEPLVRARRGPLPQPRQGLPRILLPCPPLRFLWSVQDPLHNSWSQQQDERQGLLFKNYPEFQDDSRAFNQEWSPSERGVYVTAQAARPGSRPEWMQPVAGLLLVGRGREGRRDRVPRGFNGKDLTPAARLLLYRNLVPPSHLCRRGLWPMHAFQPLQTAEGEFLSGRGAEAGVILQQSRALGEERIFSKERTYHERSTNPRCGASRPHSPGLMECALGIRR